MFRRRKNQEPPWKEWERRSYRNGIRHAIFSTSGDRYVGEWENDLKGGKGYINNARGWLYEGDWKKGMCHGHGVLSKKQINCCFKIIYIGGWCFGKKDGKGRKIFKDGAVYDGNWSGGKRCGHGRMWYKNGDFYEGDWYNDLPHGYGIYVYANGCRYEGEWQKGLMHGYGRFYHLNTGQLQEGLWSYGICRCSRMVDIAYRQSAIKPTKYPIPNVELLDSEDVCYKAEKLVLENNIEPAKEKITFKVLK